MDVAITRTWSDGRLIFNSTSSRREGRQLLGSGDASKLWKPDLYVSNMRELNTIQYGGLDTTYLMHRTTCSAYNPVDELVNTWLAEGPKTDAVYFGKDEQSSSNTLRLPNYQAYISYCRESLVTSYVWGNSSTLRLYLTLDRELTPHLLETYLPTGLFVIISWGSFTVKPENVPGRMVLLVTNLLSLVTLFESVRNNSPAAMGIKCMDVWLVACILFIFLALVEYIAAQKREATKEKVSYMCEFLRKCRKMLQYVYQTRPTSMWDPLDKISVFAFPFMFMICNAVYWPTYITMRSRLDLPSVCTDE
uniref:Neurotransmitter-gated ion-channel transmembrane domain-containing protein n=1 Tax=Timema tahoe TaxID=61484 RepID=A0A7R9FHR0_9NEOP|nr:unnamed protein product [Timema tahoe]